MRRDREHSGPVSATPDDPLFSLLDLGAGTAKVVVAQAADGEALVLGWASVPRPPAATSGAPGAAGTGDGAELSAAERALEAAEDQAGVIPRRVALGVSASVCGTAIGHATVERPRPAAPITVREWRDACETARENAVVAARRAFAAEYGREPALEMVHHNVLGVTLDSRPAVEPVGRGGSELSVSVVAICSPLEEVKRLRALAGRLDLEVMGLVAGPAALGAAAGALGDGPAIIVDAGAAGTGIVIAGAGSAEAAGSFPIGSAALEARLEERTRLDGEQARLAVEAHSAGAGHRGPGGGPAGRALAQLARHHADVWLDAFEAVCADLARGRVLPARILLCGGGALLPELRRALASPAWHTALPFERAPAVRLLSAAVVPGVRLPPDLNLGPDAVTPLALAAAVAAAAAPRPQEG